MTKALPRKKSKRRGPARHDAAMDSGRLLAEGTALLLAAEVTVTADELMSVAGSAERSAKEAYSPCACRRVAALLIEAEKRAKGLAASRRFDGLVNFFMDEIPAWRRLRRAEAEDALARKLGA